MQDMITLAGAIFDNLTVIFDLYVSNWLLSGVLSLWLIRKVYKIYNHL